MGTSAVAQPPLRALRTMASVLLAAPVLFVVLVVVLLPLNAYPPAWLPLAMGAVGVAAVLVAETVGYAAPPLAPGTPPARAAATSLAQYRARWFLRFAATEAVVVVGVALSFAAATAWPGVVGFVLGWPLMLVECWPSTRTVEQLELRLERDGVPSHLADALAGRLP